MKWITQYNQRIIRNDRLGENKLTSKGAILLFGTLRASDSKVQFLDLTNNIKIDDECMASFGEFIKSNKSITHVYFNYTGISDVGIETLIPYLDGNTALKDLYFHGVKGITDKSIPFLLKIIDSSFIQELIVYDTSVTVENSLIAPLAENRIKSGSSKMLLEARQVLSCFLFLFN